MTDRTLLKKNIETYGKQIDIEITRGVEEKVISDGTAILISDAYEHDNSLAVTARRRNLLNLGAYSAISYGTYDAENGTITVSFADWYFSYIQYTYLNEELMNHRGQPLTFSVKEVPEGTRISVVISGARESGATYQEFGGTTGLTYVTGVIAEDFTSISRIELRLGRQSTTHTQEAFVFEELQLEFGYVASEYTPYIEDITSVSVSRVGKNLFNVNGYTGATYYAGDGIFANPNADDDTNTQREYVGIDITSIWDTADKFNGKMTISFDLMASTPGKVQIYALGQKRITTKFLDATTEWQRFSHTAELVPTPTATGGNVCTLSFYGTYGSGVIPYVKNIQIELGEEATELEEFNKETAAVTDGGAVLGLTTIAPVTVLTTTNDGVYLEAVYKKPLVYASEKVVSCAISYEGDLLGSVMKQAEIELDAVGGQDFAEAIKGDRLFVTLFIAANGETAHKEYGNFIVKDAEYKDDTNSVAITAYDIMVLSMKPYQSFVEFPDEEAEESSVTLGSYLQALCDHLKITLATPEFTNSTAIIDEEKYNSDYTYRDVLTEIAQAAAGTIAIKDDALALLYPTETELTVDPTNLKTSKVGKLYGPVNSVILARTPQEDNIYKRDETQTSWTEIKIENNQLMDSHREDFIDGIYERLYGLKYYPYEIESFGIVYLDVCDRFTLKTLDGKEYSTIFLGSDLEITQGIAESSKVEAPTIAETDYSAASKTDRAVNKTILRVDKQEQVIEGLVSKTTTQYNEMTGKMDAIQKSVNTKITPEEVSVAIEEAINEIDGAVVKETGYTFNKDGLRIKKSGEEIENLIDNSGMYVNRTNDNGESDNILTANNEGVTAINLEAKQFLIVGENSRFEDYETNRTACFYIGG